MPELKTIELSELKCVMGEKIVNGIAGQWYRHDVYLYNGKEIGRVQVRNRYFGKRIGSRIEAVTCVGNNAVLGRDVNWLCKQNGLINPY